MPTAYSFVELFIVAATVAAAVYFLVRRFWAGIKSKPAGGCGKACGGGCQVDFEKLVADIERQQAKK